MKILYVDTPKNVDHYISGVPTMKVRLVFEDDNSVFVYYTEDTECKAYINKIFNIFLKPDMFDYFNLLTIEDDEQYERYEKFIQDNYNFQAIHKDSRVDGSDEHYKEDNNTKLILD